MLGELEGQPRLLEDTATFGADVEVDLVLVVLVHHRHKDKLVEEEEAIAARQQSVLRLPEVVGACKGGFA